MPIARNARPCEICGAPTASKYGVCQRTRACKNELIQRVHTRTSDVRQPCEICGKPTWSEYGVCNRLPDCRPEHGRRLLAANGPTVHQQRRTRYEARAETLREQKRQAYAANPDKGRQQKRRAYWENPERQRERGRQWREKNIDRRGPLEKAYRAKYRARADRPCKYAAAGCTEFALPGNLACREHGNADRKRRYERRRSRLVERLAATQGGMCTWCGKPLPADLTERLTENRRAVEVDHVIPKAVSLRVLGYAIEDEWNLRALHWRCNGAAGKYSRLTPEAIALAAEHGIMLDAVLAS